MATSRLRLQAAEGEAPEPPAEAPKPAKAKGDDPSGAFPLFAAALLGSAALAFFTFNSIFGKGGYNPDMSGGGQTTFAAGELGEALAEYQKTDGL